MNRFPFVRSIVVMLLVVTSPIVAQDVPVWHHTDGPAGPSWRTAFVRGIAWHPSGVLFSVVEGGRLYRSSDDGATWRLVDGVPPGGHTGGLHITSDGRIYVTSWHLYRSDDTGRTWQRIFTAGADETTKYAVTSVVEVPSRGAILTSVGGSGVYASFDDGATWRSSSSGLSILNLAGLLHDGGTMVYAVMNDHLFRSTDNGEHWSFATLGLAPLYQFTSAALGTGGLVYIAEAGGTVARSSDSGFSWEIVARLGVEIIRGMSPRGELFGSPARRSTDSGASWQSFFDAPLDAIAFRGDEILTAIGGVGLVRSTDRGESWQPAHTRSLTARITAIAGDSTRVAAAGDGIAWISDDLGLSWHPAGTQPEGYVRCVLGGRDTYAGTDSGLYRSSDAGMTWMPVAFPDTPAVAVTAIAMIDGAIMAGTADGRLFTVAADSVRANALRAGSPIRAVTRTLVGHLLVAAGSEIHRSFDGETWRTVQPDVSGSAIHALAMDALGYLYAGVDAGVVASDDGGTSWRPFNEGLEATPVTGIAADRTGYVFLVSDRGVSTLVPGRRYWKPVDGVRSSRLLNTVAIVPGRTVLLGTDGDGFFRGTYKQWSGVESSEGVAQTAPEPFTLSEPVPNPALCCAAEMTLVANDERVREVTIELLDARGAVVRLLYRGQLARGDAARRIAVEPEGLPSGTYFVRLRSESFELVRRVVMVK